MSNTCHGCKGNGWVSPNGNNAVLCPVCEGSGVYARKTQTFPFKIMPFEPFQPFQPQPYFYGPQVMYDTLNSVVEKTTDNVLKVLQNKMQNQAKIRASV